MNYETYQYIYKLIVEDKKQLETDYLIAIQFIPSEPEKKGETTGLAKAHKIFSTETAKLNKTLKDFHKVVSESYKNHPDPEMRKFWGLE